MGRTTRLHRPIRLQRAAQARTVETTKPAATAARSPLVPLQQSIGNRVVGRLVQARLKVAPPGDREECEADRVADQILRMPAGTAPATIAGAAPPDNAARTGRDSSGGGIVGGADRSASPPTPGPSVQAALGGSGGDPLSQSIRSFFEPRLGANLSAVRVHTGPAAIAAASEIRAGAFTHGHDIYFGRDRFAPATSKGQHLLAHELVHTVQQSLAGAQSAQHLPVARRSDPTETEAERRSLQLMHDHNHEHLLPGVGIRTQTANRYHIYRQPLSGGTAGGTGPARRVVYVDANVFDQINRGNQNAATALRQLRTSGADIRISQWAYSELVDRPAIPRTAEFNRLIIQELGIRVDPAVPFAQRVDIGIANQMPRGGTVLSPQDAQVAIAARAGGGEVWSFDHAFRTNPQNVLRTFGVHVAPESHLPLAPHNTPIDYRVGRRLLGLPAVDISLSGEVERGGVPPAGGGRTPPPPPPAKATELKVTATARTAPRGPTPEIARTAFAIEPLPAQAQGRTTVAAAGAMALLAILLNSVRGAEAAKARNRLEELLREAEPLRWRGNAVVLQVVAEVPDNVDPFAKAAGVGDPGQVVYFKSMDIIGVFPRRRFVSNQPTMSPNLAPRNPRQEDPHEWTLTQQIEAQMGERYPVKGTRPRPGFHDVSRQLHLAPFDAPEVTMVIGARVPATARKYPVPAWIAQEFPSLKTYSYVVAEGRMGFVDPNTNEIKLIINL